MINLHGVIKENIKQRNLNWPPVPNHPYRISIIAGLGSGKTNSLLNSKTHQQDTDNIYLSTKDPCEPQNQFLINKWESADLRHFNNSKDFIDYLNDVNHIYKNNEEYNPNKKQKILIFFDDMIADILSNKKKLIQ